MSIQADALNSSGNVIDVTGNTVHGIRADTENMGERSKKPGQSSRSEYNNLKLTREELLALFQEDIRLMQKAGIQIEVIPQLYPHIFCGVVLKNVTFIDDDFRMIGDG